MTVTTPNGRPPQHASRPARRRVPFGRIGILLVALVGVGVMLYPSAASWFSARAQNSSLSSYAEAVQQVPTEQQRELLAAARQYNSELPHGRLRDPYSAAADADNAATNAAYLKQLSLPGTDVMARLSIPAIEVDLPVYHGTGDDAIERGAGHMLGSSLPVGGAGTHAVLAAHSGLPNAKMLTDLEKLKIGDTFTITVMNEQLWYRVDRTTVVKPDDLSALTIVDGADYVTLVTCTPVHVNSHRLLVRGERIDAPENAVQQIGAPRSAGFPWWALIFVTAAGVIVTVLFAGKRQSKESS